MPANSDFDPGHVRYIKLGRGGLWADQAISEGIVPFGYHLVDHTLCAAGDWDAVRQQLLANGRKPSGATQGIREIRDFYELGEDTLWVTMADGHLWWAFADKDVKTTGERLPDVPSRYRATLGGWRRESLTGEPLAVRNLSSALTRTATYRMTICSVERADYLIRRIKGEVDPLHVEAKTLQEKLRDITQKMIQQLHWEEFETLVDLIFARGGWRRTSLLGGNMPDVDLILDQPVTGETAWVQVKTASSQSELNDYVERFERDGSCDRFFFVCHSGVLEAPQKPNMHVWAGAKLADLAVDVGLFDWLVQRTR